MFQASLLEQVDEANGCKQSVVRNRACSAHRADTLEHRSIVYAEWCRPDKCHRQDHDTPEKSVAASAAL